MIADLLKRPHISLISLLLALLIMFTGCNGNKGEGDTDSSGESVAEQSLQNSGDSSMVAGNLSSGSSSTPLEATSSGEEIKDISNINNAPKDNIHILMWRKYTKTEEALIASYTKKTGIKIYTTVTTEKEYATKLVSLASGRNSPDIVCFSSGHFPGLVATSLQPLEDEIFSLQSECWHKPYMDAYKINGRYFGVAMNKSWSCENSSYITYYNPAVLRQCGITEMPYQLYTQGKWNWDRQTELAKKITTYKPNDYVGLALQSNDLFMCSAGEDFATYNGQSFTNKLKDVKDNSLLVKAWKTAAELNKSGVLSSWSLDAVKSGKVGIFSAATWGLCNESGWFDSVVGGYGALQAVPIAGPAGKTAYTPIKPMLWGVAKNAKNPEGAAYFLRFFLDVSNISLSATFYNRQFETVYQKVTAITAKKKIMIGVGITDYLKSGKYLELCNELVSSNISKVFNLLTEDNKELNISIEKANSDLAMLATAFE